MNVITTNEQDLHSYMRTVIVGIALLLSMSWCVESLPSANLFSSHAKYSDSNYIGSVSPVRIDEHEAINNLIGFQYAPAGQAVILK
ncbi:hypothetical protein GCM10010909_00790 [Acidocella aquatica]|uniref:Uncharacterized protein n=1 Tax=Acidocella aquatica TaxID=1922313 RepID=A0ABQ6A3C9_9PROT|nr:hypothetical protein [Acidocella aquatica]GLR65401.1 hypothetical protein GCM10010909_00790 [Acidocella aquatica]